MPIGDNLPIDYISDHIDRTLQFVTIFHPGKGWSTVVYIDERKKYETETKPSMNESLEDAVSYIEQHIPGELL